MLARVFKVSTGAYKTKASFRNYRIGYVPDRGGRITLENGELDERVKRGGVPTGAVIVWSNA